MDGCWVNEILFGFYGSLELLNFFKNFFFPEKLSFRIDLHGLFTYVYTVHSKCRPSLVSIHEAVRETC